MLDIDNDILFLHPPKTAGTSISKSMSSAWCGEWINHYYWSQWATRIQHIPRIVFGVWRNPVARFFSSINWQKTIASYHHHRDFPPGDYAFMSSRPVSEIVDAIHAGDYKPVFGGFTPQKRWSDGVDMVWIRYENLEHEYDLFVQRERLPYRELEHWNSTSMKFDTDLPEETLAKVKQLVEADLNHTPTFYHEKPIGSAGV
jgi:hypothetical protein